MVLHKLTGCKSFWFSAADQWLGRGLGVAIGGLHGSGHFKESADSTRWICNRQHRISLEAGALSARRRRCFKAGDQICLVY